MNPILRQQTLSFISITCSTPISQSGTPSQAARPMREPARTCSTPINQSGTTTQTERPMREPARKWIQYYDSKLEASSPSPAAHTNQPVRSRVSGSATNERTGPHLQNVNQPIRNRVSDSATNERTGPQMNPILRQQTLCFISITCSTPISQSGAASQAARPMIFIFYFYVRYSTLLHLLPLRFYWVGGCWDRA